MAQFGLRDGASAALETLVKLLHQGGVTVVLPACAVGPCAAMWMPGVHVYLSKRPKLRSVIVTAVRRM